MIYERFNNSVFIIDMVTVFCLTWLDIELRRTLSCALWLGIQPSTSFSQPQHLQLIKIIRNRVPGVVFGQKLLLVIFLGRNY